MEAGADIKVHDNEGLTAVSAQTSAHQLLFYHLCMFPQLHWLACNGRTELLMSILNKGEFVDVEVCTGLLVVLLVLL